MSFQSAIRLAGSLLLAGCAVGDAAPLPVADSSAAAGSSSAAAAARAPLPQSGRTEAKQSFGEPITESVETPLATIAGSPAQFIDKTVKTTGKVQAVCQMAGCWMEIGDDASRAHIKMSNHSFFVPKTSTGHTAVIQGVVMAGEPQNGCGEKDSCGGAEHGAVAKLEIVATGVEFLD